MKTKSEDIYQEAVDTWGQDIQLVIAIEELSELIKEICKYQRYGNDIKFDSENLVEEIAGVQIMLNHPKLTIGKVDPRLKEEK